jgi:hypothetical protein
MPHKAIRYGDEYQCHVCGKAWGVDEDEPACLTPADHIKKLRELIDNSQYSDKNENE